MNDLSHSLSVDIVLGDLMDATPNKDVSDEFKVQVRIRQKNTVNTSPVGSVNRLNLGFGRGGPIRTGDPLHPMQVRYLAALRPDCCKNIIPAI